MGDTKIEWATKVWNPVTGCTKVSAGCKNCYAERIFHRPYPGRDFTDVRTHPERLAAPLHWRKPQRVFVNSMSDLFHEKVDDGFIRLVARVMQECPRHRFLILTKRPERMSQWNCFGHPSMSHVWLGVSIEHAKHKDRIDILRQTPATIRFVSIEPLIADSGELNLGGINWVIVGGETGPGARPMHPDWARSVRDQCQAAGVPFFFKQWGEWEPQCQHVPGTKSHWKAIHNWDKSGFPGLPVDGDCKCSFKTGKRVAGRLLDGREWNEFPVTEKVTE